MLVFVRPRGRRQGIREGADCRVHPRVQGKRRDARQPRRPDDEHDGPHGLAAARLRRGAARAGDTARSARAAARRASIRQVALDDACPERRRPVDPARPRPVRSASGLGRCRLNREWLDPDHPSAARHRSRAARPAGEGDLGTIGGVVVALALELEAVVRFRLYENGRMVDEYLSVPTFYGELPKADELALEANPTLVARLTGAKIVTTCGASLASARLALRSPRRLGALRASCPPDGSCSSHELDGHRRAGGATGPGHHPRCARAQRDTTGR